MLRLLFGRKHMANAVAIRHQEVRSAQRLAGQCAGFHRDERGEVVGDIVIQQRATQDWERALFQSAGDLVHGTPASAHQELVAAGFAPGFRQRDLVPVKARLDPFHAFADPEDSDVS